MGKGPLKEFIAAFGATAEPDADEKAAGITSKTVLTLGNVEFWIDKDGPWAGELSYSLESRKWNWQAITESINTLCPSGEFEVAI